MANVDNPYSFDGGPLDNDTAEDVDIDNISILRKQLNTTDELIAKHNTFDVIDLKSDFTLNEQFIAHRLFVTYLRSFREDLNKTVEELTNG